MTNISNSDIPWIEKYRPKHYNDLIVDDFVLNKIKRIIEDKDMPNLIITGIPGIGKTSTVKCLMRILYGNNIDNSVLELNASDDRGIKIVQNKLVSFCNKKVLYNEPDKYPKHKTIILDEADNMTPKAQAILSTLIEKYYETTRFAFTCNSSVDIIESIQSKCNIIRYIGLSPKQIYPRLKYICDNEKITYTEDALDILSKMSNGDIRNSINNLQLIYNYNNKIDKDVIYKICDKPQPKYVKKLFDFCIDKKFKEAVNILYEMKNLGFVESDIILNMVYVLRHDIVNIDEDIKIKFLEKISDSSYIMAQGFDNILQLTACISNMINCLD